MMNSNPLLSTDVYKLGHMEQYPDGTNKIYSYLQARTDKTFPETVFFGLRYYVEEYLKRPITQEHADEFFAVRESILGPTPPGVRERIEKLVSLGYWPVEIKAVLEGDVVPVHNALLTITNTHDDFAWCVGFLESLLLKVWNTCTVATYSLKLRELVAWYAKYTCDDNNHLPFQVHDFGYRGVSSEETAALSGAAHLLNFLGTDTVPAVKFLQQYYNGEWPIGLSVPASEHSVMCSFTREQEIEAFEHMLNIYPSGIVSIVSDTYDLWNVLTNFGPRLKDRIMAREGRLVFRPDSGDPQKILCGDPEAPVGSNENLGVFELLGRTFGYTVNSKGYKVLDPHVGVIYGDGFHYDRFVEVLKKMTIATGSSNEGWASSNLVVGVGGLLLQQHHRDELGFAIKATYAEVGGIPRELFKDPITDRKKASHKGLLRVYEGMKGGIGWTTFDEQTWAGEKSSYLATVFKDGESFYGSDQDLKAIRDRISEWTDLPKLELPV